MEKTKLPPGSIMVLVDELKDALGLFPKMYLLTPEHYQDLIDRIARLEKQLKPEKKTAHACKLTGKLDGDFVALRAEFTFTTDVPRSNVVLGLQGVFLTDEGDLDRTTPLLDYGEDGYVVRVEKEGMHLLVLNLKLAVGLKRSPAPGAVAERGFDLGLPGAAVTTLALDLPAGVREIRWNENVEKQRVQNRWELALGKIKQVNVSWKEPASLPGQGPLLTSDALVALRLEETHVLFHATLTLQDLRGQTTEWRLLLPTNAQVEVKTPGLLEFDLIYPDLKTPFHVLKLKEPSAERMLVDVQVRIPRPLTNPKIPIGPFAVDGAYRQQGTLTIQGRGEAIRGHRLIYHRHGEIYPRDLPKNDPDALAVFQFWTLNAKNKKGPPFVPLELEVKAEKALVETKTEHVLRVKRVTGGLVIDSTSRIHVKAQQTGVDGVDIQLPRAQFPALAVLGASVTDSFPAALPWAVLGPTETYPLLAQPLDFFCDDTAFEMAGPDGLRKTRVKVIRGSGRDFELVLTGKYVISGDHKRSQIQLPRPLHTLDRGGKVTIQSDEQVELLDGPAGAETPASDKHSIQFSWDRHPEVIDLAWASTGRDLAITSVVDLTLRNRSAQVRQNFSFSHPHQGGRPGAPLGETIRLKVPGAIGRLIVISGGKLLLHEPEKEIALIALVANPANSMDLVLDYDFTLKSGVEPERELSERSVQVPLVWVDGQGRQEIKVRVWPTPGTYPLLSDEPGNRAWRERGAEIVPERDSLPALVIQTNGVASPLFLRFLEAAPTKVAAIFGDRALIQVAVDEDGSQTYRCRYLIRKLTTRELEFELPLPASSSLGQILLDQKKLAWFTAEKNVKLVRVPVDPALYAQPAVFEIQFKLPATFFEGMRLTRTRLYRPRFVGDAALGPERWQVSLPDGYLAVPIGKSVRLDWQWGMQGWLLGPEPSVDGAKLESWFAGRESADPGWPVGLAFWGGDQESVTLWRFSWQNWRWLCSGSILLIGLLLALIPLSRAVFRICLGILGVGIALVCWFWPEVIPPLVMGGQPGIFVLTAIVAVHWLLREKYKRQVVLMPGFSQSKPASSLSHKTVSGKSTSAPRTREAAAPLASTPRGLLSDNPLV